jgi:hypothetical protein
MVILITVYHSGLVIMNEIGSYEFVGIKKKAFLLNGFSTLENLVGFMQERLGWMDESFEVRFKCLIDIGSSNDPRMKMTSLVCNEKECTTYVRVIMKSEIRRIELVVRMVGWNNVGDENSRNAIVALGRIALKFSPSFPFSFIRGRSWFEDFVSLPQKTHSKSYLTI